MKKYSVEITPKAEKLLGKLDRKTNLRIKKFIQENLVGCENPRLQGKALTGDLKGNWRYRVGDYRIIAQIEDEKILITVVDVNHRRQVYR